MRTAACLAVPIAMVLIAFRAPCVAAETVTLGPSADLMVSSLDANRDHNYGAAGSFAVSAAGSPKGEFQSLVKFDLAAAKASFDATYGAGLWAIASASLQLMAANPNHALFNNSAAGQIVASWMQNDNWAEGLGTPNTPGGTGVTWNSLGSILSASDQALGSLSFDGATSGSVAFPLSITSGLAADAAAGSLLSLRFFPPAGETTVSGLFNSRSFNTPASRPVLTLNAVAVPEPATAALAMIGMMALFYRGRRTHQLHGEKL
jgi:hypothetical protein